MVKIRLSRAGAKKRPFFPIVVADSRSARDAQCIEKLGFFNPIAKGGEERLRLDLDRLDHWVSKGAQVSDRVVSIVKEAKLGPEAAAAKRQASADKVKAVKLAKKAAEAKAAADVAVETAEPISAEAPAPVVDAPAAEETPAAA
jgi:small subunit ribosomal protein S16